MKSTNPQTIPASVLTLFLTSAFCLQAEPHPDYPYWPAYHVPDNSTIEPQPWVEKDHAIEGWDWSLPPHVEPSPRGLLGFERNIGLRSVPRLDVNFPANPIFIQWVSWREIEPVEGEFDWQPLLDRIEQCRRYNQSIIIRILGHTQHRNNDFNRGHAPRWLEDKGIALLNQKAPSTGTIWKNYDPADPVFHRYYLRLIDALRQSGIPQMETVRAMYAGYASSSLGDEGIGPHGMDPANEPPHVKERLDAWAAAASGVEHKIFMGGPSEYGFAKGFGVRRGFVEKYLYTIPSKYIGQQVDENGYLYVDEDAPVIRTGAFNGEVNEEYGKSWATAATGFRFGKNTDSFSYRYFMSNLRLVQMRCTYVHNAETLIPEMLPWVAQQLGRTVEDTPDIWAYLNTSYLRSYPELKHFERWLYQRDQPGFETTPVVPISNEPVGLWMVREKIDHMARQGSKIGFAIDDRFVSDTPTPVAVKVSYIDQIAGSMSLYYRSPAGSQSRKFQLFGDGKLRTTTIIVDDLVAPAEGVNYDMVFYAPNEAVVSKVRVVKL